MQGGYFLGFVKDDGRLELDNRAAFLAYVRKFKGEEVELEIRKRRTKRSDRQNRAFHAMVTPWANEEGWAIDDLKRELMGEVFGRKEFTSPVTGEMSWTPLKFHTSKLTVQEFNLLMERAVEIAAGCGVILQLPDEYLAERKKRARAAA